MVRKLEISFKKNKDKPWAIITQKQQWQLFVTVYSRSLQTAKIGVDNAKRWGIRFADGRVKMYPPIDKKPRLFEKLPLPVREIAVDIYYNIGPEEFQENNWGGIFQMDNWNEMANYIEGSLSGDILDENGKETELRAETFLAKWHSQAPKRVEKILRTIRTISGWKEHKVGDFIFAVPDNWQFICPQKNGLAATSVLDSKDRRFLNLIIGIRELPEPQKKVETGKWNIVHYGFEGGKEIDEVGTISKTISIGHMGYLIDSFKTKRLVVLSQFAFWNSKYQRKKRK